MQVHMVNKKSTSKNSILKRLLFRLMLSVALFLFIFVFSLIVLVKLGVFGELPGYIQLKQIKNKVATNIYSVDNKLIGRYYYQNRTNVSFEELPEHLVNALIATEDARFYEHNGLDYRSTLRVIVKSIILMDRSSGGGSTLTQQLAKNLFPRKEFKLLTIPIAKIKEILTAIRIEKLYTKNDIIELYLNTVPFGENTYGIETAALTFFNKEPSELSIDESAVLVGLLKANTGYNPRLNQKAALKRRNIVLSQMCRYAYLKNEDFEVLKKKPIQLDYHKLTHTEELAPYFREHVRQLAIKLLKDIKRPDGSSPNLYTDGLKIYTTLNAQMQIYLEKAVQEHLSQLQQLFDKQWQGKEPWKLDPNLATLQIEQSKAYQDLIEKGLTKNEAIAAMRTPRESEIFTLGGIQDTLISPLDSLLHHFKTLQTGALVMNARNGDVLAWVGGVNFKYFQYDHVMAKRQTGSTIKPIVYASALEKGVEPCDFFENDSVVYTDYDSWTPQNSSEPYGGFYSVKGALAQSINTISVKLLLQAGIDSTIELANRMGISSKLPNVPSMALGTGEVSLYDMVKSYAVFVNQGRTIEPRLIRRIEDADGNLLYADLAHEPTDSVILEVTAQQILAMLQGVVDRGTANSLRSVWKLEGDFAGKTGTTQNNTDAWFMGITPRLVAGVWVGGDNPVVRFRTTNYGQGAYAALPVYANFMQDLYNDSKYTYLQNEQFQISDSVYSLHDCNDFEEDHEPRILDLFKKEDENIGDFIKRIFKRKRKRNKDNE
jgi:penicillin-binding protein 1A